MVEGLVGARRRLLEVVEHPLWRSVLWLQAEALVPHGSSCVPRAMLLVTARQDRAVVNASAAVRSCGGCERYAKLSVEHP